MKLCTATQILYSLKFCIYMYTHYGTLSTYIQNVFENKLISRPWPIMPKILPIMLLSIAQKLSLLCSKLCFQNQDYAPELTVLLEYISVF